MSEYKYILRYYIDPGFHEDERIEELIRFCRESTITEVMLFNNPEELFAGYMSNESFETWLNLAEKVKNALDAAGIAMSVNPWATTVHCSRGRKFSKEQQNFQPMAGETGTVAKITACPLCENWQNYLCDNFASIARRIKPCAIWVEDDWRLHNHGADMGFGGCFCPLHLQRFAKITECKVTREDILEKILAPGKPHPWRKLWRELWRDTMLEPARKLQKAVSEANASTKLALMSSSPDVHSIEGRDWHKLQKALQPNGAFFSRPHLPPYTETRPLDTVPSITRQTIANLQQPFEIYPELENSPRCGRYSKSAVFSAWECLHSVGYGSRGITINHYDMMGNGTALDPEFGKTLAQIKPRLDAVCELEIKDSDSEGIDVLFSPEIAGHIHAQNDRRSCLDLKANSNLWSDVFYILGISHRFTHKAENTNPTAVCGQTLRAFGDKDIRKLMSGVTLLDAESVQVLCERGFGELTGVKNCSWHSLQESGYAYEVIEEKYPAVYTLAMPRMTAQRCAPEVLNMDTAAPVNILSWIHRFDHSRLFPGMTVFKNLLGGRVISMAYPLGRGQFFMGFFNNFRRILIQNAIQQAAPGHPVLMAREYPLHVYRGKVKDGTFVEMVNPTFDPLEKIVFAATGLEGKKALVLNDRGQWLKAPLNRDDISGDFTLDRQLPGLEAVYMLFKD